jgi:hypothetical protein
MHFIEGHSASTDGPLKYMSRERIDEIHEEIDRRMTELSDSGLSRREILYEDAKMGVPLQDDAFFQLLRHSRTAREMLILPNEAFTADRVIEKALRQDIGADPSQSMNKAAYNTLDPEDPFQVTNEYKKKYRDTTPLHGPDSQSA